ncbi:hypothetical protein HCN44_006351 [Aphidius gifuensis]|uniref:Splicing factor YJU2 n=1 Tax=Aphidius gifuensis TaxID=684658 RepID=A0A834XWD9_APHGI|nr:hypothetical protein HCN44_006351 [Aphidius gifuensis]
MSERKVSNKYYSPDFDPSEIPRMKLSKNSQSTTRLMAPFNMKCNSCGEYIYKGKKFNAREEDVDGDDYLGITIKRFYIKCTRCLQEISFKTDPEKTDYVIEAGATRNFMALKLAEEQAQREDDELKEEEATNPMKLLEKRIQQSKQEIDVLEALDNLKDLNRRQQTIDYDQMLEQYDTKSAREKTIKEQEEIDEEFVQSVFNKKKRTVVEEEIIELTEDDLLPSKKIAKTDNVTSKPIDVASSSSSSSTLESTSRSATSLLVSSKDVLPNRQKKYLNIVKKNIILGVKPATTTTTTTPAPPPPSANDAKSESTAKKTGLLLLGSYSDTDSEDSD